MFENLIKSLAPGLEIHEIPDMAILYQIPKQSRLFWNTRPNSHVFSQHTPAEES